MHPLNVYGYHVRYGHSEYKQKNYKISESVCFSPIFNSSCKSKYYRLFILKGDADLKKYHSNYCFFDKKEIINHLKQLPKFCKITFRVTDTTYKEEDAFQLDFFIDSNNRLIHKYVLTWIRSLFEWPYYLYLVHAKKMKKLPEFRFESVINLFNTIATTYRDSFCWDVHTFGVNLGFLKKSEIKNRILNKTLYRVNDVFPRNYVENVPQCNLVSDFSDITDKLFEDNLPKYVEAYYLIKSHENSNNR